VNRFPLLVAKAINLLENDFSTSKG